MFRSIAYVCCYSFGGRLVCCHVFTVVFAWLGAILGIPWGGVCVCGKLWNGYLKETT